MTKQFPKNIYVGVKKYESAGDIMSSFYHDNYGDFNDGDIVLVYELKETKKVKTSLE